MKVSVLMPACNQGPHVLTTCESAHQSLGDIPHEIVVLDDQSTDGCCDNLQGWVKVIRPDEKLGCPKSRIRLQKEALGDVLLWCDPHCDFPGSSLADLCTEAYLSETLCQPIMQKLPGKSTRYGGVFRIGVRGIGRKRCFRKPKARERGTAPLRAVVGGMYACRADVWRNQLGWMPLSGLTSFQDTALSLTAWFAGVTPRICLNATMGHMSKEAYSGCGRGKYPFPVGDADRILNNFAMHYAFFPRTWEFWKRILHGWRPKVDIDTLVQQPFMAEARDFLKFRRRRTEREFFAEELNRVYPTGEKL